MKEGKVHNLLTDERQHVINSESESNEQSQGETKEEDENKKKEPKEVTFADKSI